MAKWYVYQHSINIKPSIIKRMTYITTSDHQGLPPLPLDINTKVDPVIISHGQNLIISIMRIAMVITMILTITMILVIMIIYHHHLTHQELSQFDNDGDVNCISFVL